MRVLVPALLAVLLVASSPPAAARASSELGIEGPPQVSAENGPARVPFRVGLTLKDFACGSEQVVRVALRALTRGPDATLPTSELEFVIPQGTYLNEAFQGAATAHLTVWGRPGDVEVSATFSDDLGRCVTSGKMPDAEASWVITVNAPRDPDDEPAQRPPTSAPGPVTTTPTPSRDPGDVHPDAGYVGDSARPAASRFTPGPGLLGALVVTALAALALRARHEKR